MVLLESPDDEGPPSGNVTFEHDAENGALLVTYREGDEIPAGQLRIRSADANTTWAAVANMNESAPVTPGAIVRLSRQSEYGAGVDRGDRVELVWFGDGGNQTAVLDSWPS
ncbi:type IV pilin [Halobacteriales archaeon QS_1_68_17]|nr:MAG: type IV pilin [Halobacteriales archaeon QS_1_68_17]